jgi:predicted nuclease with TOPRIM domain
LGTSILTSESPLSDLYEDYFTCKEKEHKFDQMLQEIERLEGKNLELQAKNAELEQHVEELNDVDEERPNPFSRTQTQFLPGVFESGNRLSEDSSFGGLTRKFGGSEVLLNSPFMFNSRK